MDFADHDAMTFETVFEREDNHGLSGLAALNPASLRSRLVGLQWSIGAVLAAGDSTVFRCRHRRRRIDAVISFATLENERDAAILAGEWGLRAACAGHNALKLTIHGDDPEDEAEALLADLSE
jgi:hypothetical protein